MGRQLETRVSFAGVERPRASVHLDSRALQVSGRPRIEVTFAEVQRVQVAAGRLSLSTARGLLVIDAGEEAEAWAAKILAPPSRAKKLGLCAGQSVAIAGLDDAALLAEIEGAGARLVPARAGVDLLFFGAASSAELARLPALIGALAPAGALWVVRMKGRGASVSEGAVRSAARGAGLVDVKVVAFSDTQSADKFVIPLAARAKAARAKVPREKAARAQPALEQPAREAGKKAAKKKARARRA